MNKGKSSIIKLLILLGILFVSSILLLPFTYQVDKILNGIKWRIGDFYQEESKIFIDGYIKNYFFLEISL